MENVNLHVRIVRKLPHDINMHGRRSDPCELQYWIFSVILKKRKSFFYKEFNNRKDEYLRKEMFCKAVLDKDIRKKGTRQTRCRLKEANEIWKRWKIFNMKFIYISVSFAFKSSTPMLTWTGASVLSNRIAASKSHLACSYLREKKVTDYEKKTKKNRAK